MFTLLGLVLYILYLSTTIAFEDRFAYVLYADGEIINAQVSDDQQWRIKCTEALPEKLAICLTLFEDQYFYYHPGINPVSIIHAVKDNIKAGRIVRGGSTLTMQLARIHEGNQKRTYWQKCKELLLAFALEIKYSKNEILMLYAQYAPYGGNTIGYCAAAHRYYSKDASLLSWSEAATLSVLPNAPSKIYPGKGQEVLVNKRNALLKKLLAQSLIDSISYRLSILENLPSQSSTFPSLAPHLLQECKKMERNAFSYVTTLDRSLQTNVNRITQNYRDRYALENDINNIAAIVLRNDGTIAAYVANTACPDNCSNDVDILTALRSPGSTLKPFLYAASLESGMIGPQSLLEDIPIFYNGYSPVNFDKKYRGVVHAESALTQSLNIPAVQLLQQYGVAPFYEDLRELQFSSLDKLPDHYGLSLILGGGEVTGLELAAGYMNLVRSAKSQEGVVPSYIHSVNKEYYDFPFTPATSFTILEMLKGVHRPDSQDGWKYFSGSQDISWKTGTSFGFRDAWSVGSTSEYTVLVWVGNADGEGKPGLMGVKKAAPILFDIFELLPRASKLQRPISGFVSKEICVQSGYVATAICKQKTDVWLPYTNNSLATCKYHRHVTLDQTEQFRVFHNCASEVVSTTAFVLPLTIDNYYKKFTGKSYRLPPYLPGCTEMSDQIEIMYPSDQSELLLPIDIDQRQQSLVGKAVVGDAVDSLYWFVDYKLISVTSGSHKLPLDLSPGKHTLTIVTPSGKEKSNVFTILE